MISPAAPPSSTDPSASLRVLSATYGTVESTPTPGAAISTSLLTCEKSACWEFLSTAATETTEAYPAG